LTIGFSSSLDEAATNESWGLRNFILYLNISPSNDCAILYDSCGYTGNSIKICGSVPSFESAGFNNNIFSIYIPQGYQLKLFDGSDYQGCAEAFTESIECFEQALHFQLMSFKFEFK